MESFVEEVGNGLVGLRDDCVEKILVEVLSTPFCCMLPGVTTAACELSVILIWIAHSKTAKYP